jgi:predicted phosphodiesterase
MRSRARLTLATALVVLVALVGVQLAWGWSDALRWSTARWRFGVGEPVASDPYADTGGRRLVRLAAAGDVGTGGRAEYATAAAADRLEATGEFDALVLLGDNVYPDGEPERVKAAVLDPFAGVLDGPTRLVAALGNHDVRTGDGVPQLRALGLPGRWYTQRIGPVELVVVDSTRAGDPEQLAWLERTLAAQQTPWTIVAQHHPPYSAGYHGSHGPSRDALVPLFERFDVDLVLAGHDHDYQRIHPQQGVHYVVSGGAATLRRTGRASFTATAASTYHFVEVSAYADRLELRAVNQAGRVFDKLSIAATGDASGPGR